MALFLPLWYTYFLLTFVNEFSNHEEETNIILSKSFILIDCTFDQGSLRWAHCMKCKRKLNPSDIVDDVMAGRVPTCQKVTESDSCKGGKKRRHSEIHGKNESYCGRLRKRKTVNKDSTSIDQSEHLNSSICGGVIKPGVTFFGEKLKDEVSKYLEHDYAKADALIVIGTSLSV